MGKTPDFRFFRLIRRNLANRPYRNVASVFIFALIAATLFSSQFLMSGAIQSLDAGISRMGADILIVPEENALAGQTIILTGHPTSFFFEDSGFEKISRIRGVAQASPQIYIATLFASCCAAPVQMIAIDPENDFTVSAWLVENPGVKLGKDDIIIGSNIIQDVGKDLMFYGHIFHVAGVLDRTGTGVDNSVFTRFEDAYTMADESELYAVRKLTIPKGMVSAVLVRVEPGASPAGVAAEIEKQVPGTKAIMPDGLLHAVNGQLAAVMLLLNGTTLAVTVVSIPLLGVVSAMVAHERRREISLLRALGATRGFIVRLMLAESFALAGIGSLIGIAAAAGILLTYQDYITYSLQIPFIIPSAATIFIEGGSTILLALGIAMIASLYPALTSTRSDPYETIRKGAA
ncbi:abc transporter permease protein [hydrocarbon metagenome]|uniref:Abc transporter permease protein n=1 Tax=hydrocarbon metagenome TaxID=938273 RepID=A0A0W8EYM1_9ZZZZ